MTHWRSRKSESLKFKSAFSSEILLTSSSMSGAECKLWLTSLSTDTSKAAVRRSPLAHSSASWAGKVIFRGFSLEGMVHCKTCVDVDTAIPSSSKDNLIATLLFSDKSVAFERDALHGIIKWHSFLSFAGSKNGMECQWMSWNVMRLDVDEVVPLPTDFVFSLLWVMLWHLQNLSTFSTMLCGEKVSKLQLEIWHPGVCVLLCAPARPYPMNYSKLSSMHTF